MERVRAAGQLDEREDHVRRHGDREREERAVELAPLSPRPENPGVADDEDLDELGDLAGGAPQRPGEVGPVPADHDHGRDGRGPDQAPRRRGRERPLPLSFTKEDLQGRGERERGEKDVAGGDRKRVLRGRRPPDEGDDVDRGDA